MMNTPGHFVSAGPGVMTIGLRGKPEAPNPARDAARLPHNETFARVAKSFWLTAEHSQRSRGFGSEVDRGLAGLANQYAGTGNERIDLRRDWSDNQWIAFMLGSWRINVVQCFMDHFGDGDEWLTPDEHRLMQLFGNYHAFYESLPSLPPKTGIVGEDLGRPLTGKRAYTIDDALAKLERHLEQFEARLGDPLLKCDSCKKCATGKKMLRCSRCKSVWYCGAKCQKKAWRHGHKASCSKE